MASIYKLAEANDVENLEKALKGGADPNEYNEKSQRTALSVAVFKGHIAAVRVLLKYRADPDGLKKGRTPLWVACHHARDGANSYEALIQILLDYKADAKLPSQAAADQGSTPLIEAMATQKSPKIISALIDRGADPKQKVNRKSATDMAENRPEYLNALEPSSARFLGRVAEVSKVTGFVMAVIYWANRDLKVTAAAGALTAVGMISKNAIRRRFGVSGNVDDNYKSYLSADAAFDDGKPAEKRQLKQSMTEIIKKHKLDRFFQRDDPFLEEVVSRAVDLNRDPDNLLDVKQLAHLAFYQPVLYCDDSSSMKKGDRRGHLNELAQRITSITTRVIPDKEGIELRFINEKTTPQMSKPSLNQVDQIITSNPYYGWTEIGNNLRTKVLQENVYKFFKPKSMKRPVLVSIITDGHPGGGEGSSERRHTLRDKILECGNWLDQHGYQRNDVRFQISQIGSDPGAEQFLNELTEQSELKGVLFITSDKLDAKFEELHKHEDQLEQWLLKLLLAPIVYSQAD